MATPKSHRTQALEAMQRNKRMARTLGCLVASMTLGAALLDWVKPTQMPAPPANGTELMSRVRQGTAPIPWKGIQLDPQAPGDRSHFVIDRQGHWAPTTLWLDQEQVGNQGMVRIGLVAAENSNQVTVEQVGTAQHLVNVLQRECGIASDQVHHDMLAVPQVPEPAPSRPDSRPPRSSSRR